MTRSLRSLLVAGFAALLIVGTTSPAAADEHEAGEAAAFAIIGTSIIAPLSTATTLIGGPLTTGGIVLTFVLQETGSATAHLRHYMRRNAVALQHDLHTGGGDTTRDLAAMFEVPAHHDDEFAELLYERRDELAPLAEPGDIDHSDAATFGRIISEGILERPDLAEAIVAEAG